MSSGFAKPAPAEMILVSSGFVRFSFSNPGVSKRNAMFMNNLFIYLSF